MTNLILIMTDNQGAWTLGSYGNPDIQTPHLDHMAQHGMRFTNAYCANAVCSPNRATVLTGLIPSHTVFTLIWAVKNPMHRWVRMPTAPFENLKHYSVLKNC